MAHNGTYCFVMKIAGLNHSNYFVHKRWKVAGMSVCVSEHVGGGGTKVLRS